MRNTAKTLFLLSLITHFLYANEPSITTTITLQTKKEFLSNNYPSWHENNFKIFLKHSNGWIGAVETQKVSRYNLDDKRIGVSLNIPVSEKLKWHIAYTKADKGIIVPKTTIYNQIVYGFNQFLFALARKKNHYETGAENHTNTLELITYHKDFRFAYGHNMSEVKGAGNASSDKATAHYFYNNHYTAFTLSLGEEIEALPNGSTLSSYVKSIALYGNYKFSKEWACGYALDYTQQGSLYTRKGVSLAAIYQF